MPEERSLAEQVDAVRNVLRREQQHGRSNPALVEAERTMTHLERLRHELLSQTQPESETYSDRFAQEMLAILKLNGVV